MLDRQKLRKFCDFEWSAATLTHEMGFGRQKLKKKCDFELAAATLPSSKIEAKLRS